jgi:transposase
MRWSAAALIASVGIDLSKTTFHLVALDCHAKVILRKKFLRTQLLAYTANLPWSIIGMEACSGAHFFAAKLRDQGHEVKLSAKLLRTTNFIQNQSVQM